MAGVNYRIGDSLDSPNAIEYAAGVSRVLGQRGSVRADWVFRDFNDFYITRTDLSTGTITNSQGTVLDMNLIENSNDLERRYQAGTFQANYRVRDGVEVGGNYTLSRTWGNFDGENPASGPLTAQLFSYPEYRQAQWNQPEGNLGTDQRHRARIWGTYRVPMSSSAGSLDVGVGVRGSLRHAVQLWWSRGDLARYGSRADQLQSVRDQPRIRESCDRASNTSSSSATATAPRRSSAPTCRSTTTTASPAAPACSSTAKC